MSEAVLRYNTAIAQVNNLGGNLNSALVLNAKRHALKDALRALREIIAEEPNPETRAVQQELLGTLKRLHFEFGRLEHIAVHIAVEEN